MNNFPEELMKPPDGYEWTGEFRKPHKGETYGYFDPAYGKWELCILSKLGTAILERTVPILRKVKPSTVMVELPRGWVEYRATGISHGESNMSPRVDIACREALEREANE